MIPPPAAEDPDALYALAMRQRDANRRDAALANLERAAALAAPHPAIAHAIARTRLEAGLPAGAAFERAIALAPADSAVRLGLAAARLAEGQGARALEELSVLLSGNPGWSEGHVTFAKLCALVGQPERSLESVAAAVARVPDAPHLVLQAIDVALAGNDYPAARSWAEHGARRFGPAEAWTEARAIACSELGEHDVATAAFAELGEPDSSARALHLVRHRLRIGALNDARTLVERWLDAPGAQVLWPYAATIWRLTDPARAEWLECAGSLVTTIDLGMGAHELADLAQLLRRLHAASGQFADQSVRQGTQTDGELFARIDPPIVRLRAVIEQAVADFVQRMPPVEPDHPTLHASRRGPVRFAGSWSVRLEGAGRHIAHHHPSGWLSSAFYVAVPEKLAKHEGALEFGRPPADLGLDLPAQRTVEPRVGTLALFPSWMWHATTPFFAGERMTVAFDVAQP